MRLAEVQARLTSLEELGDVVSALRMLSVARVRQAHAVIESMRTYATIVHEGLREAVMACAGEVKSRPPPAGVPELKGSGVVVAFGSERGFVGAFNERILERAARERQPGDALLVVGTRASLVACERHRSFDWSCAAASHVGGIDEVALGVAEGLSERAADGTKVVLVYTRATPGASPGLVVEKLLPFDMSAYAPLEADPLPPVIALAPKVLLDGLVEEAVFAQLGRAVAESFASENVARLGTMEAASSNVDRKLEALRRLEHEARQEEITTELLDVVVGVEAISRGR